MIVDFKKTRFPKTPQWIFEHPKIAYPVLAVIIIVSFLFIDQPLAHLLLSAQSSWSDILSLFDRIFSPMLSLLLFPFLCFFIRFIQKREKKSRKIWFLCFATALPILAAKVAAIIIGRATPEWMAVHGEATFRLLNWNPLFHSFPYATSCNIGAIAAAAGSLYPKYAVRAFIAGFAFGLIPALLPVCFLSDAIAGVFLGMILSIWVFRTIRRELMIQ